MKMVECTRNNTTPKVFYNYCKKKAEKLGIDLSCWSEYEDWADKNSGFPYFSNNHEDWDEPKRECGHWKAFDVQLYLQGAYNFIMEFNFDDDKKGTGYFYICES